MLALFGVLTALFAVFINGPVDYRTAKTPDDNLRLLKVRYFEEKANNVDHWWLERVPGSREQGALHEIVSNRLSLVHEVINRYQSVSPFAEEVSRHFQTFYVTLAIDGRSSVAVMSDVEIKLIGKAPELTFIAKDRVSQMDAPFSIYWRSDWGMMMHAVDHPPAVFAGFLYHELGHGYLHPVREDTKFHDPASREYILEECQMHGLETLVNDKASGGKFKMAIGRILERCPKAVSAREAVTAIDSRALRELDLSLDASGAGIETAQSLFAQYLMAIGLEFIASHNQGDEEKVALFQWVQTIL